MATKIGKQTIKIDNKIAIVETATVAGEKESKGPLKNYFDEILNDSMCGEHSWEKAESKIVKKCLERLISKANIRVSDIDFVISGDLLNQITSSTFAVKDFKVPFFGIYGACATCGEGLALASMLIDSGAANKVITSASSHFCTAEKQFRAPLEQGGQRPPSATWTVTGAGTFLIEKNEEAEIFITYVTPGKIMDFEINDAYNMGAVMAPAAADTIINHLMDTDRTSDYYDLILTGDLGKVGVDILNEMTSKFGIDISSKVKDCGLMIFDIETQDVDSGGSGPGCSAVTFAAYIYDEMKKKNYNKVLFVPTGAMLSTISTQQGENIPAIAYAIAIERGV